MPSLFKKSMYAILISIVAICFSLQISHAHVPEYKWSVLGRLDYGYGAATSSSYQSNPQGSLFFAGAVLSYQSSRWLFDGSAGFLLSDFSGQLSPNDTIKVVTRTIALELSSRYRLGSHWQLGPSLTYFLGNDHTLGTSLGGTAFPLLPGIQGVYETHWDRYLFRISAQVSANLPVAQQAGHFFLVGIQIGLPEKQSNDPEALFIVQAAPEKQFFPIILEQVVHFRTNSYLIDADSKEVLTTFIQRLNDKIEAVSEIEISGHADCRGKPNYNKWLSQKRAESIYKFLRLDTRTSKSVRVQSYSSDRPIDPNNNWAAWKKNRRVEIQVKLKK